MNIYIGILYALVTYSSAEIIKEKGGSLSSRVKRIVRARRDVETSLARRHAHPMKKNARSEEALFKRRKGLECDERLMKLSPNHTLCLDSVTHTGSGVSAIVEKVIVDKHNELRGYLEEYGLPFATDMLKVSWNDEIAAVAQKWADNCEFRHDKNFNRNIPGRLTLGQNIALGQKSWEDAITDWFNENNDFEYGKGSTGGGEIGHFTQLVWSSSSHVGCGFGKCPNIGDFYVCNYGPAGNSPGSLPEPYSSGKKGEACPLTFDQETGLCDCGDAMCYNGGNVDPDSCKCQCVNAAHITGPNCSVDCSAAEDISQCASKGGPWGDKACKQFANVPYQYCPKTCKLC
ncbi:cysteine-rich secretory protein 3-like [Tubulanus polymorphus]|uniref:cysteine-rich secretory protein 3-like n=1 Tax=Tubulanus polymorphus TaxID=672921 RepID=UPI003DA5BBFE